MIDGRLVWLQEEDPNEDISIAPIIWEQFSTSVLFKDIQDAFFMILHCRIMLWFWADSSNIFTMLDVDSIFILSSTLDWYLEVKIRAIDRQYSSCLLILGTKKVTRILTRLTWMYHVMHNTWIKHGNDIKTRFFGSTSILRFRKDWNSIRLDRMRSSFKIHFQLIAFQKLLDWKLEKSYTKKYACHLDLRQRSRWSTNGQENWVRKLLDNKKEKLLAKHKFSNQPNQIQFVTDRGDLLTCKMEETRPVLRRPMLILLTKNFVLQTERGDCWNRGKSNTFIWRQQESQCWADSWQNGATCCYSSYSWSTRQLSSMFCPWKRYAQRWWWSTS